MFQSDKELTHPCLPKWRARIDAAERRGKYNRKDATDAKVWNTCACHETVQRYGIAVAATGCPMDNDLRTLGLNFAGVIGVGGTDFAGARTILTAIEARLSEIFAS
jgi:hypothetical protein